MAKKIEIACCLALKNEALVYNYLMPLARHPLVSRLWIIRSHPCGYGDIPKSTYLLTSAEFKPVRWLQMLFQCLRLARRPEVRAFVSFNPLPYGLISSGAAGCFNTPVHFGFIGSDWYRDAQGFFGRLLRPLLKQASFYTATGDSMRSDLIRCGFDPQAVAVLPHCIDLERYPVSDPDQAAYACIFVGQLIRRKRVDLILDAFAKVLTAHPHEKLCIVGDGPLKRELIRLSETLGIRQAVDFVGYTGSVQEYFARAKIVIIASYREGLPFALIEGICCGNVPVSTPAGTITDLIKDGENGLLFPEGDTEALAACLCRLLDDRDVYSRLRTNALKLRAQFSYEGATAVWDAWFKQMEQ
ncbi:MAG: glycosyltransferase family 4 protein [Pseudomonadota bacterium]